MSGTPNILDLLLLGLLGFFLLRGIIRGFIKEIMGLIGLVGALVVGAVFYKQVGMWLARISGIKAGWWDAVGFVLLLVVVLVVAGYLAGGISRLILEGPMSGLNRLAGGIVGLLKGLVVCYLLVNVLLLTMPMGAPTGLRSSVITPYILKAGGRLMSVLPAQDLARRLEAGRRQLANTPHKGSPHSQGKGRR